MGARGSSLANNTGVDGADKVGDVVVDDSM